MSSVVVYESDREFSLFRYRMGHGMLLFRSDKSDTLPTSVEILFTDVWAMETLVQFEGIRIEKVDLEYLRSRSVSQRDLETPGLVAYRLVGASWEGYVLGS